MTTRLSRRAQLQVGFCSCFNETGDERHVGACKDTLARLAHAWLQAGEGGCGPHLTSALTPAMCAVLLGMVKYGIEIIVPRVRSTPTFVAAPDLSLRTVMIWQQNGKNQPDTPMCSATYGRCAASSP